MKQKSYLEKFFRIWGPIKSEVNDYALKVWRGLTKEEIEKAIRYWKNNDYHDKDWYKVFSRKVRR